jgi:hypothetical protein
MTSDYIWDCGTQNEHDATEEFCTRRISKDIHNEFIIDGGKIQYSQMV